MNKLTDLYNNTKAQQDVGRGDVATKTEMDKRIEDRRSYPPVPEHNHPAPDWAVNPDNEHRKQMRTNEQRINDLRNRLDRASRTMNRDFDRSR